MRTPTAALAICIAKKCCINPDYIDMMRFCGVDFHSWLDGFEDTEKSVRGTVDFIVHHPLIPVDVKVYGFIIDSTTGELTRIV